MLLWERRDLMKIQPSTALDEIRQADTRLSRRFVRRTVVNPDLDRTLVSFQANKTENGHRWCKYKEGFSAELMRYVFRSTGLTAGSILDPFAGSGTAVFAANEVGIDAVGIELLPSSADIIRVRELLARADKQRVSVGIDRFLKKRSWESPGKSLPFPHVTITRGAFPAKTEELLGRYLYEAKQIKDDTLSHVLRFGAMCILESISFTRKDGQYLRWDSRSGRRVGGRLFNKGPILDFTQAISAKLTQIAQDLAGEGDLFRALSPRVEEGSVTLLVGSCLEILPTLGTSSFHGIVTSPPYCNRYDYTRTYALELAMLGVDEQGFRDLRQSLLSCTVENREKSGLKDIFDKPIFDRAIAAFDSQELLVSCHV